MTAPLAAQDGRFARLAPRRLSSCALAALLALLFSAGGCGYLQPSNHRDWAPENAVLSTAEFDGDLVTVRNVRNNIYVANDQFAIDHYDKTYDLRELQTIDFIVVPMKEVPGLAHTMLSFGFDGGQYVAVSGEIRKEKGESYKPFQGVFNQYELMYVVGDERDLVKLRTNFRNDDVYLYRSKATPEQARLVFVDVMQRVNKLAAEPEFYNTLTNNCTSNIVAHVNKVTPGRVSPWNLRAVLPGFSDRLAYDLGLIESKGSFEATKYSARVSHLAQAFGDDPAFSQRIRQVR